MSKPKITEAEYREAVDQSQGWCTNCKDFTCEMTEPDAEHRHCPVCEEYTVLGAELALIAGMFEFEGDADV